MFYCDPCAQHLHYPTTAFKSEGQCEICHRPRVCNDCPSSSLPLPPPGIEPPPWALVWEIRPCVVERTIRPEQPRYEVRGKLADWNHLHRIPVARATATTPPQLSHGGVSGASPKDLWADSELLQLAARVATVDDATLGELLETHAPPKDAETGAPSGR